MIIEIFAALIFIIISAFLNRFRGGWPPRPWWMPLRSMVWASLFYGLIFLGAYFTLGLPIGYLYATISFVLLYMFGNTFGWGSYYNIGANPRPAYKDEPEVGWIDWILFKVFGPTWIPASEPEPEKYERYDVVKSPTGEIRGSDWLFKRELTGMTLRGSLLIPLYLVPALIIGVDLIPALIISIITAMVLFPFCYYYGNHIWVKNKHSGMRLPWGDILHPGSFIELSYGAVQGIAIVVLIALAVL